MVHTSRCSRASSTHCSCSCGGAAHGGGGGIVSIAEASSDRDVPEYRKFFGNSLVQAALTHACMAGLTVVAPGAGLALATAYTTYNYSNLGYTMFKAYNEFQNGNVAQRRDSLRTITTNVTSFAVGDSSDKAAAYIVDKAKASGYVKELAGKSGVEEVILTDMLEGTTSQAINNGFTELARFGAGKVFGA